MGRAGRGGTQGRLARGPGLHRVRARERDRLPHVHSHGARSVRSASFQHDARADPEAPARGATLVAQGRVPGLNGVSSLRTVHAQRPDQLALLGGLLALAVVAWLVTGDRMGSMESTPGMALGGLGFYVTVWVAMMAAMMIPSVAPTVLMYDRLRGESLARGDGAPVDATALFVCGYLLMWTAAGLVAYVLVELVRSLDPPFLAWDEAGR